MGRNPRTGKYDQRTRRFHGTYTEARQALRDFVAEIEDDQASRAAHETFRQHCDAFMEARRASGRFSDNRMRKQESALHTACRHIGEADFAKITPKMLEEMYVAMLRGETWSGRPASGTYVLGIHHEVSLVYKEAVRVGLIDSNPCERANPPRCDSEPRRALSRREYNAFLAGLDVAEEHDFAWWLAASLGLRRGEVCGLAWGDVDVEGEVLHVRHSYDVFGSLKATKTRAGRRDLPLTARAVAAFKTHRRAQERRGVRAGAVDPVVLTERATRVPPDVLGRWWSSEREGLGAAGFTLHELRHSYLTALARAGVHPRVMQELAGHSSCVITMNVYAHVDMESRRAAAEALDAMVGSGPSGGEGGRVPSRLATGMSASLSSLFASPNLATRGEGEGRGSSPLGIRGRGPARGILATRDSRARVLRWMCRARAARACRGDSLPLPGTSGANDAVESAVEHGDVVASCWLAYACRLVARPRPRSDGA